MHNGLCRSRSFGAPRVRIFANRNMQFCARSAAYAMASIIETHSRTLAWSMRRTENREKKRQNSKINMWGHNEAAPSYSKHYNILYYTYMIPFRLPFCACIALCLKYRSVRLAMHFSAFTKCMHKKYAVFFVHLFALWCISHALHTRLHAHSHSHPMPCECVWTSAHTYTPVFQRLLLPA